MSFRLRNQNDPDLTLGLNTRTWYGILELAETHGWNPMGTVLPELEYGIYALEDYDHQDIRQGEYWNAGRRLVLFEDALNMSDALERAVQGYQPQSLPSLHVYALLSDYFDANGAQPSLGAIQAVIDICQPGSFYIEKL